VKYALFPLDELPPGTMRPARIDGIDVVVVCTTDGELHALRDICPHQGARLSGGKLEQMVIGDEPGVRALGTKLIVRCPWHGHEFDVDSGRCPADSRQRVRTYDVTVENDTIVVHR
jgi:nitrite reductase (NADH) small subunit